MKFDQNGYDFFGYGKKGFDREGKHRETGTKYNPEGYNQFGYDKDDYDKNGFNIYGEHRKTGTKYNPEGYDRYGYDREGYDKNGYDEKGKDREGYDKNGFDKKGYNREGFNKRGYNREGYDKNGYDRKGYDKNGLDRNGFNADGIHKDTGTQFNSDGYGKEGYDKDGYDKDGLDKTGKNREGRKEIQQMQMKNWLGLRNKVEKLAKGQMTIEEYIMKSKISLEDLIAFAKKEHFSADIVRGLYKYMNTYKTYTRPFKKKEYLENTILIINGEEIRPTEQEVDSCIEYLKENGTIICDKTVRTTISQYKRGKIDIKQRPEQYVEESTKTQLEILEEEQRNLEQTLENVEQLESEVTQAENKDKSMKIGD